MLLMLDKHRPNWPSLSIHESSPSVGGASARLRSACSQYVASQYFADVPSGSTHQGWRCEDLEALSFGDASVDHGALPPPIVVQLMALVDAGTLSDPVSARAIRTLTSARSDVVRDWLIGIVSRKSTLLRRLTLAEPTLPVVSALHVLTKVYADDPVSAKVMEVARSVRQEARWQVRESGLSMERTT